ncbi:efflux RND transporter periplasmic adaptor subunit, partial [Geminisphaera colitermitum]|uniref:efflux RND transporter periplasmic adaptor subunit n=1 Tax=Geminisphaera colitermitum TaxID=1148786 RepID=UPI000158C5D7
MSCFHRSLSTLPVLFCGLALLLATTSCKRSAPPPAAIAPVPVRAAKAELRTVPLTHNAVGIVRSLRTVEIQSQVDGVIEEVHFRDGDTVKAGAPLVTLDRRPFVAGLALAEAELKQAQVAAERAKSEFDRYKKLIEGGLVSQETFLQYSAADASSQAAVAGKEAAVASARLNLGYATIKAPFAGRTSRLALREGSLVKANDATRLLLTINQIAPIAVEFSVTENILASVRAALAAGEIRVVGRLQDGSGREVIGHLDYIDNTVDATTGTIALRAVFPNEDHALWPGLFVSVTVFLGELRDATVVSAQAIMDGQQGSLAFIIKEDNSIEIRDVTIGRRDTDFVVVTKGIQPGETIVTDGQIRLTPRSRVTIIKN